MKALIASALFAFSTVFSTAQAETKDALMKKAEAAYSAREYSPAGIAKAQEAASAYADLAGMESDAKLQAKYLVLQSEALYFVGNANDSKAAKQKWHLEGLAAAEKALAAFGVVNLTDEKQLKDGVIATNLKKNLSAEELTLVGEALYNKGINLGQWGQAKGVMASIGRWPELKATMLLIKDLGLTAIHEYGANRVIGRGLHRVPAMMGGNIAEGERLLREAVEKTKVAGQIYSKSGFNNLYLAEILADRNKESEAKTLLEAFVKADPKSVNPDSIPEIKQAQADAKVFLKDL